MTTRRPQRLISKILLYMLLPTLLILTTFNGIISLFYGYFSMNSAISNAASETAQVASRFQETYTYTLKRFIDLTVSEDFRGKAKLLLKADGTSTECNNLLQDNFSSYIHINNLISSVTISRRLSAWQTSVYYPYSLRLKHNGINLISGYPSVSDITFLPSCESPYMGIDESIPVLIPLHYFENEDLILIPQNEKTTDFTFCLFFDTSSVHNFLRLYCSDDSEGILYLTDQNGQILSLPSASEEYQNADRQELRDTVSSLISDGGAYMQVGNYHVFCSPIIEGELFLINAVPESTFMQSYTSMRSIFLTIGITTIVFVAILSIMISFLITQPLKKLMLSLHSIETNTYQGKIAIRSNDEIEQLNDAIHSMYCTIQKQITQIHQEETEKYDTQMQLLSEQMNPHFLYNTLEFINMEIFCKHHDNASNMISNLGNYLRTGLAYGENLLTLSQEVDHALSYINIMNYRFSHSIQVTVEIPDELLKQPIVKCILQPLVENSLKHGFEVNTTASYPFSPFITIMAKIEEPYLKIAVIDNGIGIDVETASQVTKKKYALGDTHGHVGLNNVYRRLCSYYKDVDITFSSIPFYENKVTIILPAIFFTGQTGKETP